MPDERHLDAHREIEYVWFDFPCMPQQPRSPQEDDKFTTMLTSVNVIFLGMKVLILLDMSYVSRFWVCCREESNLRARHPPRT